MAQVADSHDMDAYLINPTLKMQAAFVNSQPRNMAGDLIPIFVSDEVFTFNAGKKNVDSTGTLRKLPDEPTFTHGYNSEEEAASPTEGDDEDFYSLTDTDSEPSIKVSPSLEDLLEESHGYHANAVQLSMRAQAVQFVSAGQAKVVSVPKRVEVSAANGSVKSLNGSAAVARLHNLDQKVSPESSLRTRSTRSSSDSSTGWPLSPSPPAQQKTLRRKPNLSLLQPLLNPSPQQSAKARAQTPLSQQRADFTKPAPVLTSWPLGSPTSPQSAKRKPSKLSPSLKLKGLGRSRRSNSSDSSSPEDSPKRFEWYANSNPPSSATLNRSLPKATMPKMVARGASERAAPLILPPCPYDNVDNYDDDNEGIDEYDDYEIRYATAWPLRNESDPASQAFDSTGALKQLRRKSVSAAVVTSQA